tara:strand:- start:269 stop:388 length:120 start_codon:yes stop_codon:yes gene_type:complete
VPAVLGLAVSVGALAEVGFAAGSEEFVGGPDEELLYGLI